MSAASAPRLAAAGPWARILDLILPVGMIASILVIMVPVPAELMDLLLAANITIAVIMLLTTLSVRTPLEFNVFPSLLLTTTLFRLVLNVATTRLILTRAATEGRDAAGGVVRTFGQFVTGGATGTDNIVVGLIIFSIIVLIQFVVITKGATRISEVAARFTLDGMPGRQMAIDADLNAGIIDEQEAQRRRQEIIAQADFFGAMDGASKFVRGDAVAGLVIILINIVGGLFIGIVEAGMSPGKAGELFTTLTIGDGLVTQIPAFLISLAAGLLVTRSSQESNLPREFLRQFFSRPQVLAVAGGFLAILIFTSLPRIPLLLIGAGCAGMALTLTRREHRTQAAATAQRQTEAAQRTARVEDYLTIDPMELELGVGLIRFADARRGGDLLERIQRVRQSLAAEMGIILPKVRVRDNMRLEAAQYRIKIADVVVAQGTIDRAAQRAGPPDHYPFDRDRPPTCRRVADARRGEAPDRRIATNRAGHGRRVDPRRNEAGRGAASLAVVAARGGAHSPVGPHSGNPGRPCPAHEGSDPAHRACPATAGADDLHAVPRSGPAAARRDARSGAGGADPRGHRAQRGGANDSPLAAGGR